MVTCPSCEALAWWNRCRACGWELDHDDSPPQETYGWYVPMFGPDDVKEIRRLVEAGHTGAQIARELDVSSGVIYKVVNRESPYDYETEGS